MEPGEMGSGAGHPAGRTARRGRGDRSVAGRDTSERRDSRDYRTWIAIVLALICAATVRAQDPPAARPPMAEDVFRNVQVLRGIPVSEFMGTMGIIALSVGRGCSECHK